MVRVLTNPAAAVNSPNVTIVAAGGYAAIMTLEKTPRHRLKLDRLPVSAGIGLRLQHMPALAQDGAEARHAPPWLEVHSENFLCDGGPRLAMLDAIAARTSISCHGVGLSLASAERLDEAHLARLRNLYDRVKPAQVSEHLAWSVSGGDYLNDLLPLPTTATTLDIVSRNVAHAQQALGRRLLVENPSAYLTFPASTLRETDFLNALAARTGCGLLLDVNNIYVTMANTAGEDTMNAARAYIDAIDGDAVGEIHLAGHSVTGTGEGRILIDTHSARVAADVWDLYRHTVARIGAQPTLIEWDMDVPALSVLLDEAARAQEILTAQGNRHVA